MGLMDYQEVKNYRYFVNALVVLITGSDEHVGPVLAQLLLDSAEDLPEAWHTATWGRST
jgi:hypothetical protein